MKVLTANHCFALITLEDDSCVFVEAGFQDNSKAVAISFRGVSRSSYLKYEKIDYSINILKQGKKLSDLVEFLK